MFIPAADLSSTFASFHFARDNKLHQFPFRVLNRTVVTRRELEPFGLADNDKCIYCSVELEFAKLYSQIISWLNLCQGTAAINLLN